MACGFSLDRSLHEVETAGGRFEALRAQTWVVDGNAFFSRPGPRLVDSVEIMAGTLSPGAVGPPAPTAAPGLRGGALSPTAGRKQAGGLERARRRPRRAGKEAG